MSHAESCAAFIADVRSNTAMTFTDTDTLGKVTILLEGDCEHVMMHLPYLLETSATKAIERILGVEDDL
jgi:hypothetical protein